jgi:UDP-2,3-diacylglucosamine pyrophosphatase LpxH
MTSKKLLIQIYSDIHIELWNKIPELPVKSKYLFLAGDICTITHPLFYPFFDYCSNKWEKVFYTPGNHEFYLKNKNYNELSFEYKYKLGERYKNIFYLDNEYVELDNDTNVYGTTFWTVPPFDSVYKSKMYLNDYNWITYFDKTKGHVVDLDTKYVKELSNNSFNSLQTYLNKTQKKTIVMTHFPPLRRGTSNPKYLAEDRTVNLYFSWPDTTLNILNLKNVPLWISGHTHWSYDFIIDSRRFISNQIGYKSEIGESRVNEDGLYEITIS